MYVGQNESLFLDLEKLVDGQLVLVGFLALQIATVWIGFDVFGPLNVFFLITTIYIYRPQRGR